MNQYFPTIALTGSLCSASTDLSDLFKDPAGTWSCAAGLTGPIFAGGAIRRAFADVGWVPDSTVLQVQEQLFPAELEWVGARAQLCASLAGIYKALGGGWVSGAEQSTKTGD